MICFIASCEPPTPVRNISSSRPALRIAWTTPCAMSSSCVYTASIFFWAWRMFSITFRPLSGLKSPGCWATILMPPSGHFFLSVSAKPLRAVGRDRDAGEALDLDDVALALQLVGDVVRRQHADLVVVAEDRRRRGVGRGEQAVDVDDRDARPLGLLGDRRERRAVLRQHDERVGLLRDRLLDLLSLRVGVRGLEQLEVDVRRAARPPPWRSSRWRRASRGRSAARWR